MAAFFEVNMRVTLMRLVDGEFYAESGDRVLTYYFATPDSWATEPDEALQKRVLDVAQRMYADLNERFRAAEPDDPNFLRVKLTDALQMYPEDVRAEVWKDAPAPAAWEPTPCVVVNEDHSYSKVPPAQFNRAAPRPAGA